MTIKLIIGIVWVTLYAASVAVLWTLEYSLSYLFISTILLIFSFVLVAYCLFRTRKNKQASIPTDLPELPELPELHDIEIPADCIRRGSVIYALSDIPEMKLCDLPKSVNDAVQEGLYAPSEPADWASISKGK